MKLRTLSVGILAAALAACATAQGNASGDGPPARGQNGQPPKPDLSEAAQTLGISEDDLEAAMMEAGGPPPDLAKAAAALGITEDELKSALPAPPQGGPQRS